MQTESDVSDARSLDVIEREIVGAAAVAIGRLADARGECVAEAAERLRHSADGLLGLEKPPMTLRRVVRRTWPVLLLVAAVLAASLAGVVASLLGGLHVRIILGILIGAGAVVAAQRLYRGSPHQY